MTANKKQKKGRLAYMILSVMIAIVIWAMVSYINGPDITNTFRVMRINYLGTDELRANGCVVIEDPPQDLSVKVSGKRDDLMRAMDKLEVDVDVSGITEPGEYNLEASVLLPNNKLTIERVNFSYIPVTVDALSDKEMTIKIEQTNTLPDKFVKSVPSQNKIKVMGAQSELDRVASALVVVNIGHTTVDSTTANVVLVDSKGAPIIADNTLIYEPHEITVTNSVYNAVTLPVKAATASWLYGYKIDRAKTTVTPSSVTIGTLDGYDFSEVVAEISDISGETAELKELTGMYIPEDSKTVSVKVVLEDTDE